MAALTHRQPAMICAIRQKTIWLVLVTVYAVTAHFHTHMYMLYGKVICVAKVFMQHRGQQWKHKCVMLSRVKL